MEKNLTMSNDNKDVNASNDEKNEKQFKFVDKRKYSEDEGEKEAGTVPSAENVMNGDADGAAAAPAGEAKTVHKEEAVEPSGNDGQDADMSQFAADFSTFVYSLNTQALLFLGKIPNPMTGKYEKDIKTARYLIDTVDMLKIKTKGNLDANEEKLIENIIYDLRMAFISENK